LTSNPVFKGPKKFNAPQLDPPPGNASLKALAVGWTYTGDTCLTFNNNKTALFVANTSTDIIVRIPLTGSTLEPGKPEVFANRIGGGPDGLIIDEHDNLWIACNQSNEILVLEPTQGYGAAIRRGLREVDADLVCICEPDNTFEFGLLAILNGFETHLSSAE